VDPGKTTGLALYRLADDSMNTYEGTDRASIEIEEICRLERPMIVVEAFVITAQTARNSSAPWSLEMIGVARHLSKKYALPLKIQPQASSKNFATDKRLKALGWYVRGMPHGVDAQRQVLLWLVDQGWWDPRLDGI
jgi:hypothetical protein